MLKILVHIWDKVFKNGTSKICERQPFKILKGYGLLLADHTPEDCRPQILLGPFMNTLSHISITIVQLKLKVLAQKGCGLNISSIVWCKFTTSTYFTVCSDVSTPLSPYFIAYFEFDNPTTLGVLSNLVPHLITCKKKTWKLKLKQDKVLKVVLSYIQRKNI